MKFLIVEQNEDKNHKIAKLLSEYGGGSECESAFDLERGLELGIANKYDMIILGHTGIKNATKNLIIKLRQENSVPLIILSNENDVDTKIDLLNSGADSFMIYDYNENELIAVVGSILRRYYKDFGVNIYDFKSLQVNFYEKTVKINGESINIVAKMYELFEYLIRHKEIILSKNTLFNRVWGFESETTFSVVEVYISKLRKVLEQGGLANHLLTIKNAGYCWTEKENN